MGIFRKRSDEWPDNQAPHRFNSLPETVPVLREMNLAPDVEVRYDQVIIPVENSNVHYDLTLTHAAEDNAVYLGGSLGTADRVSENFALALLNENDNLNHAKISVIREPEDGPYELRMTSELRTPYLSREHLLDEVRAFDSAVTFEYSQVRSLAAKEGIEIRSFGGERFNELGSGHAATDDRFPDIQS